MIAAWEGNLPMMELFVARGNGGMSALATCLPLDPTDAPAIAAWADGNNIDLTIVGPEAALDPHEPQFLERTDRARVRGTGFFTAGLRTARLAIPLSRSPTALRSSAYWRAPCQQNSAAPITPQAMP